MRINYKLVGLGLLLSIVVILPLLVRVLYWQGVLVLCLMYIVYALSFDICVGHVGMVSLAHPAFFGVGAYTSAILATKYGTSFLVNIFVGIIVALLLAIVMSIPAFKLADISFAIGTLGLSLTTQLVAMNWIEVTNGPMCINNVPRPSLNLGMLGKISITTNQAYYYMFLIFGLIIVGGYRLITSGRIGRTFTAVRNDVVLAEFAGINTLRYKQLAFWVGASIAGAIGSLWSHYITIACPETMAPTYTHTLMVITYIGGAGRFWGVITSAVLLTILPEVLRITPSLRLIIFGTLLLVFVIALPKGIAGIFDSILDRFRRQAGYSKSKLKDLDGNGIVEEGNERAST